MGQPVEAAAMQGFHLLMRSQSERIAGATFLRRPTFSVGERSGRWPFAAGAHSRRPVSAKPFSSTSRDELPEGSFDIAYYSAVSLKRRQLHKPRKAARRDI